MSLQWIIRSRFAEDGSVPNGPKLRPSGPSREIFAIEQALEFLCGSRVKPDRHGSDGDEADAKEAIHLCSLMTVVEVPDTACSQDQPSQFEA